MFRRYVGVPHVYVYVERIEAATATPSRFLASGAVTVGVEMENPGSLTEDWRSGPGVSAAYVSFRPAKEASVRSAAEWLSEVYVEGLLGGRVLTDFDEQVTRFEGALFSLDGVMNDAISTREAKEVLRQCGVSKEDRGIIIGRLEALNLKVNIMEGDRTINIGSGAHVTAPVTIADSIENSFNQLERLSNVDDAVVTLTRELTAAVAEAALGAPEASAEQMARDITVLTTELSSDAPRKPWYRLALQSLRETGETLGPPAVMVVDLIAKLTPLL